MNKIIFSCCILLCISCNKFLDAKSKSSFAIPNSIADLQALMDYYPRMNNSEEGSGEVSADNYYLSYADWSTLADNYRAMYKWDSAYVYASTGNDWSYMYIIVNQSNTVLYYSGTVSRSNNDQANFNNVLGQAYYLRGKAFLELASLFTVAYDASTSKNDLGIPLRLNPDFNTPSVRANAEDTYQQIISDLKNAIALLPVTQIHVMRPSKAAAYGLMARTLLYMRKYSEAGLYADSCLQLYNKLIDYNTLSVTATYPVPQFNAEVICEGMIPIPSPLYTIAKVDSNLYASYSNNDLRKSIFFKTNTDGTHTFKGSYEGGGNLNSSISVDEMYLIRAECFARTNNINAAMNDLNTLTIKRWKTGTYTNYTANDTADALNKILT
jgi:hypothetical protein